MDNSSIISYLEEKFGSHSERIIVCAAGENFGISNLNDGVLLVFSGWSGFAIINLSGVLDLLNSSDKLETIMIVDNDSIRPEDQLRCFGQVLGGWGEIFIIRNGMVQQGFFGKDCAVDFHRYFLKSGK